MPKAPWEAARPPREGRPYGSSMNDVAPSWRIPPAAAFLVLGVAHWVSGWALLEDCSFEFGDASRCASLERWVNTSILTALGLAVAMALVPRSAPRLTPILAAPSWLLLATIALALPVLPFVY